MRTTPDAPKRAVRVRFLAVVTTVEDGETGSLDWGTRGKDVGDAGGAGPGSGNALSDTSSLNRMRTALCAADDVAHGRSLDTMAVAGSSSSSWLSGYAYG